MPKVKPRPRARRKVPRRRSGGGPDALPRPEGGNGIGRAERYSRLEIDLVHEAYQRTGSAVLHRLEALFRHREVIEVEGLLRLTDTTLRALAGLGFRRVDHWEVRPGGWLPLPEAAHAALAEPVTHLLAALESREWANVARARSFAVRLSGDGPMRVDLLVRRVHREFTHAITAEVRGAPSLGDVRRIELALRSSLAIARVRRVDGPRPSPLTKVARRLRRPEAS